MKAVLGGLFPDYQGEDSPAAAILATANPPLSHAALGSFLVATIERLASLGIGHRDVVAIVAPNGPDLATAFLAIAGGAVAAPLNPAYQQDEFRFYLGSVGAKALLAPAEGAETAKSVARALGIRVVEMRSRLDAPAGAFDLDLASGPRMVAREPKLNGPEDPILLLHTSGTTSRPKLVGIRQRNLRASIRNIRASLRLSTDDLGLNVMPLFHVHGLVAGLAAPLAAGGSIVATPGFNALRFFHWLSEFRPNWYTAVPTVHQAVLDRLPHNREIASAARLRFIRSSSSALPASVFHALGAAFDCPVVEAYSMTEAAHQMTSNLLDDPKPGSVGVPTGTEIAIVDERGSFLAQGAKGEVVVRGESVHSGYLDNPDANRVSFVEGWFRTGDEGVLDGSGRLRITGRLKELINRGGEKVSPYEVDEALLAHPAVAQAASFAIPHEKLGEEVGAVVVLRQGAAASAEEVRDFARAHLAAFKVPRRIVVVPEIPKSATGKIQRSGLARQLGLVT